VIKVWHRRAGKDRDDWNNMIHKAFMQPWLYFYVFPTQKQARLAIWDGMDKFWFRYIDHVHDVITKVKDKQQMKIEMINWSIIQMVGTELWQIDRLVWSNPIWVQFSEYSLCSPRAWDLIRPILAENWGRAGFNYTPRGRNHWYQLYELAKDNPNWHTSLLTVDDTKNEDGERLISDEYLQEELAMGMDYDLWLQEYYCSFDASIQGAYYTQQLKALWDRKTTVPVERWLEVHTFWDIGVWDATAIIFAQIVGKEVRVVDYLESSGEWVGYYLEELKKKWYFYGNHYFPHDVEVREFTSGKSRLDTIKEKWLTNIKITPKLWVMDGIDLARQYFQYMWFDKNNCSYLLDCLGQYHKEYDEKRKIYKEHPEHDWSSHAADAFRYMAVNVDWLLKWKAIYKAHTSSTSSML